MDEWMDVESVRVCLLINNKYAGQIHMYSCIDFVLVFFLVNMLFFSPAPEEGMRGR